MPERFRGGAFHLRRYTNVLLPLQEKIIFIFVGIKQCMMGVGCRVKNQLCLLDCFYTAQAH